MPERESESMRRVVIQLRPGSELDEILQPRGRRWGHYLRRFLERHIPELRAFLAREASAPPDPRSAGEEEP
ncbi:MAG: hypothetical protein RQ897_07010 [Thermoflexus sp.]|jgi:hypothetical protein|nr:hypothetical protein [Thermoflexus sp.]MDT7948079.1 hypothetical protein [Thermoflexus sp.]